MENALPLTEKEKELIESLKITTARLEAHIDALNETLNSNMSMRINLKLTEQSRQEFIKLNCELSEKAGKLEAKVAELEKELESLKDVPKDEDSQ